MSGDVPASAIPIGTRVSFPYGGSRRIGTVSDVSLLPDGSGGSAVSYLVDVGQRKVFVQGDGVIPADQAAPTQFDAVAEGAAYGRRRPRNQRRR
jgi:hypothetical protein